MNFQKKYRAPHKKLTVQHDENGVIAEPKAKRTRPVLSPEAEAERVALVAKREARKDAQLKALEALSPAGARPGDPPLRVDSLLDVSQSTVVPLLTLPRLSGQGFDGSALTVVERHHDGDNGGPAQGTYAVAYCEFRDAQGYRARTRGVAVRRSEMRALAECLLALADRLDSSETKADSSPLE
jgi:hypothetical protein